MAKTNFVIYNASQKLHQEVDILRSITNHKTAQLPSELPERTIQGMMSGSPSSVFDKLVPSHLNENTSSAIDTDWYTALSACLYTDECSAKGIDYQYLRMGIPLTEVFWLPAPFRFIPSNLSWFCVSIFWKAYKLAIKFFLPQPTCTFCCLLPPTTPFSQAEHYVVASYWSRFAGSERKSPPEFC